MRESPNRNGDDEFSLIFREHGRIFREVSEERLKKIVDAHNHAVSNIPIRDRIKGIPTGFIDIDSMTDGLPHGLSVVGARPDDGLTDFGLNVASNASFKKHKTLYVNPAISEKVIMNRYLMINARIRPDMLKREKITVEYLRELIDRAGNAADNPNINFYCGLPTTPDEFRRVCGRYKEEKGIDFVVLDRLQGLFPPGGEYSKTYYQRGQEANAVLNEIVSEDGTGVLVLCEAKKRREREPISLDHLRDFGALEYGARPIIMFERVPEEHGESARESSKIKGFATNNLAGKLSFEFRLTYLDSIGRFENYVQ